MFDVFKILRFFILFCSYNWYTKEYFKKKYIGLINDIKFVEDKTTILLLSVLLCLPFQSFYKKTKGKLFPLIYTFT
jgi:hypothetical protein